MTDAYFFLGNLGRSIFVCLTGKSSRSSLGARHSSVGAGQLAEDLGIAVAVLSLLTTSGGGGVGVELGR